MPGAISPVPVSVWLERKALPARPVSYALATFLVLPSIVLIACVIATVLVLSFPPLAVGPPLQAADTAPAPDGAGR